jgi:exopolyphosphatase/guanosine-5'-triphosphate,3'-diphosphate pyrophosphatase
MILGGIDIGTNTLRLLIAETGPSSFRELFSDRRITRLGQDLERSGAISPDAAERSIKALSDFSERIDQYGVRHVAAIGTSALRNASNSSEFIAEAGKRTHLDIRVVSGEEEAGLTLLGVSRALQGPAAREGFLTSSALIIDIGGGSTELIVTRPGAEPVEASLPLGAVYLTERFLRHDPPSGDELLRLRDAVRRELENAGRMLRFDSVTQLAGTAGTITTLAAMDQRMAAYDPERINRTRLSRDTIDALVKALGSSTLEERRAIPGLESGREDIILAGAVVAQEIMERAGAGEMLVSDWGLREGIVFDLYNKHRAAGT